MSYFEGLRNYDDSECSGPRPPIPGEESRFKKMTESMKDNSRTSPPSYLNWARTLSHLLEDRNGVELFKKYVEEEAPNFNDHLNFYFACEGLKQQTDPTKIKQIIGAIYRFLRKSQLSISEDLRLKIKSGLKNEVVLRANIFDPMQLNVENIIRDNIYPAFLCSEMYIQYIQQMSAVHDRFYSNTGASDNNAKSINSLSNFVCPNFNLNISSGPPQAAGTCSASGSVYGPSTSASSSGSASATDTLPRSSTLPTLHEDSELSICDDFEKLRLEGGRTSADIPMRLTRDLLLATQKRRLEIRPPGAHGYVYTAKSNISYAPNSRVDSERASVSSGGRTDSDTMSLSSCSLDGRPYVQRRQSSSESRAIRQSAMANKETNTSQVIPRTQRLHSNEHRPLKEAEFISLLIPKLEEVKRMQDIEDRARLDRLGDENFPTNERLASDRAFAEAICQKFALDEDNDQDILDQHVSRVWKDQTPHISPGSSSPCPPLPSRRRITSHDSGMLSDVTFSFSGQSLKHSKSMPDPCSSSRKLTNKWPSMNTDSGISLFSSDNLKCKDGSSRSVSSTTSKLEETKRRLEDETRRCRRIMQQPQCHLMQLANTGPVCFSSSSSSGSSSLHHQNQAPPLPVKPLESTTVVFSFCDEEYPYRTKIPCAQPTLKQFKDYLPKKGNFRFFFKTHCEDPDSPVIQEEIVNDFDILPLFEGKVMGLVKPSE